MAINRHLTFIPTNFTDKELRDYLEKLYWGQGKSIRRISSETDIHRATLWIMFLKYKIRTRTKQQALKLHWKKKKKYGKQQITQVQELQEIHYQAE